MKKLVSIMVFIATVTLSGLAPVLAQDTSAIQYTKTVSANFEDLFAELQDVIINEGLVIDFVGNVDDMLLRTSSAAESVTPSGQKSPYLHAKYLQFCSSRLTHMAVSADPHNLVICPYIFFIYEAHADPGKITLGFRPPVFGPSKRSAKIGAEILEFMHGIIDKAISE